jgi:tRNA U55 pseudouridine synthase TruB
MLNDILGLIGLKVVSVGNTKVGGRRAYNYALEGEALEAVTSTAARRRTEKAWDSMALRHGWTDLEIDEEEEDDGGDDPLA